MLVPPISIRDRRIRKGHFVTYLLHEVVADISSISRDEMFGQGQGWRAAKGWESH
jgi:hypothetical protein